MGGETSAREQKGVMQWTGTLLRNVACFRSSVRTCDVLCPLDTAAVTKLWRLDLLSCTSSLVPLCWYAVSERQMLLFFAGGLVGVDKHLFQRVSSMTLPLNYIFVLLLANIDVIPKQKQLSTVFNRKENLIRVIHGKTKRQQTR